MILCFSGTGNSALVASELSKLRGGESVMMLRSDFLLDPLTIAPQADESLTWVFPVYSWGVPPVVVNVIKRLTISGSTTPTHHLVCTCGDDIGLTDLQWRSLIERRGWSTGCAASVFMPNTYTLMKGFDVDSKEVAAKKLREMPPRVSRIACSLNAFDSGGAVRTADVFRGRFAWLKSRIIYPWFVRFDMSPKPFHHTNACVGCGRCAEVCPMRNIAMRDHRPCWSNNCALCLACYHVCPVHAVAYGKATARKGQKRLCFPKESVI